MWWNNGGEVAPTAMLRQLSVQIEVQIDLPIRVCESYVPWLIQSTPRHPYALVTSSWFLHRASTSSGTGYASGRGRA